MMKPYSFSCTFPNGVRRFSCDDYEVEEFTAKHQEVLALKVGETLVDEEGDEWERIA